MKYSEFSVVIIGSGAAGLYAALKISSQINLPDGVAIITKSKLGESNSRYAQGGIVGVMHDNKDDNVELHVADTLKAGAGLSNEKVTKYISELSDTVINDLTSYGVNFDKDSSGNNTYTLEAAHSCRRILHVGGDATGRGITEALTESVRNDGNISVIENTMVVELLIDSANECKGIITFNNLTKEHEIIYSSAVVLATGGIGQLYKYTTNPSGATGDGVALAYDAGAVIENMEFVQFHPTALALSPTDKNRFLISEAVRGEGAKLVDSTGNEFMSKYSDKRELAPRDVVARAIFNEMNLTNKDNMFLNASIIDKTKLLNRFPTISKSCLRVGIDITTTPIPVAPAAHYTMGGVKAEVNGRTSIQGLYAIGEVASTGLHGANRLASNSLLECVVCAYELADYLSFTSLKTPNIIDDKIIQTIENYEKEAVPSNSDILTLKQALQNLMWKKAGIVRNENDLKDVLIEIQRLKADFGDKKPCCDKSEYEYKNMLTVAELVVKSALKRKESRGAHNRSDYKLLSDKAFCIDVTKNKTEELIYA